MTLNEQVDTDWVCFNDTQSGFAVSGQWDNSLTVDGNLFTLSVIIPGDNVTSDITTFEKRFLYRQADMPLAAQGDLFVIDTVRYQIEDVQPGAEGEAMLVLAEPKWDF